MKRAAAITLLAGWSVMSIAIDDAHAKARAFAVTHYDLDVPDAYSLHDVSPPQSDFALYVVESKTSHAKLGLYFGNSPGFPKLKWEGALVTTSSTNKTSKDFPYRVQKRQLEGLMTFTGLRFRSSRMTPFSSIHYFASDVNSDDGKAFTGIVQSIRVARATL